MRYTLKAVLIFAAMLFALPAFAQATTDTSSESVKSQPHFFVFTTVNVDPKTGEWDNLITSFSPPLANYEDCKNFQLFYKAQYAPRMGKPWVGGVLYSNNIAHITFCQPTHTPG